MEILKDGETERPRDRETERQKDGKTERQKDGKTEREREREEMFLKLKKSFLDILIKTLSFSNFKKSAFQSVERGLGDVQTLLHKIPRSSHSKQSHKHRSMGSRTIGEFTLLKLT